MKVNVGNYTWEEVKDLSDKDPVVLLPLGAFEQHGKHLPLKVDEFMVNNIANESVKKSHQKNINAVVAPVIWSGYSPHHMDFPGTISIKDETLMYKRKDPHTDGLDEPPLQVMKLMRKMKLLPLHYHLLQKPH